MADRPFSLEQDIFKVSYPLINVIPVHCNALTSSHLAAFLQSRESDFLGVAAAYDSQCVLAAVAFATSSDVLLIRFVSKKRNLKDKKVQSPFVALLEDALLCDQNVLKVSFNMDRLATSLFLDLGLCIASGVDIEANTVSRAGRGSMEAVWAGLGDKGALNQRKVMEYFKDENFSSDQTKLALRAWASCRAASRISRSPSAGKLRTIDSNNMKEKHLILLAQFRRTMDRLDALKPTKVKNDVAKEVTSKNGKIQLSCTRYPTRVRPGSQSKIQIQYDDKGKTLTKTGRAQKIKGRSATLAIPAAALKKVKAVWTIGKPDPTAAEIERADIIIRCLQNSTVCSSFFKQYFPLRIWEPKASKGKNKTRPKRTTPAAVTLYYPPRTLNPSQQKAVQVVLSDSDEHAVTVIQGPPGTGKTTVIAACVTSIAATNGVTPGVWLVAQSNVAVKNIAEKLAQSDFEDFKILVSHDFHFDWHEHLYNKIDNNLIRSDKFPGNIAETERRLAGSRVILCTLSMLSSEKIKKSGFTRLVPINMVIVDEASQIEIGDYLPLLHGYHASLNKLVFIGDDKQLAPYGQDDIGDLQSVFEIPHLRSRACFLDTQFRMPTPIGGFISRHVYDGRLKSDHSINAVSSCRFIDVPEGKEEKSGNSWKNLAEAREAIRVARACHTRGSAFRLITPYDAQRALLENLLQKEDLPWEDKCFNVDSFQGNEEDVIIISCVRTEKIGFLQNTRRTNVMLSRCKKSMFLVTNRRFLNGIASSTLMGKMAAEWGAQGWLTHQQVLRKAF